MLRKMVKKDTQEIESTNKLISINGERSPNMALDLMASRVGLRKEVGQGFAGASQKWTLVRPRASATLRTAVAHAEYAHEIMNQRRRWTEPPAVPTLPKLSEEYRALVPALSPAMLWAAPYALMWNRHTKAAFGPELCLLFNDDHIDATAEREVFIRAEKYAHTGPLTHHTQNCSPRIVSVLSRGPPCTPLPPSQTIKNWEPPRTSGESIPEWVWRPAPEDAPRIRGGHPCIRRSIPSRQSAQGRREIACLHEAVDLGPT